MLKDKKSMSNADRNEVLRRVLEQLENHRSGEKAHAERVAVYAVATAHRMGMKGEDLATMREAALLHDVGKLTIDAGLLQKPAFDQEDRAAAQLHTILFVKAMPGPEWLERSGPMIRGHHERWDGSGYPDGLVAEEIPLGARIIAVAEAFDTALSGAGWATPVDEEVLLESIRKGAGKQFDPEVVKAFLEIQPLVQPVQLA